jgi:hypothetical protein
MTYHKDKPYSDKLALTARKLHQKRKLLKLLLSCRQSDTNNQKIEKIQQQIKQVFFEFKVLQRTAVEIRESFLQKLAEKRGNEWNLSTTASLHTIIQVESLKKTFAWHGQVMKGGTKGSIKNLTIAVPRFGDTLQQKSDREWETVNDDKTVFALLLRKNAQQLLRSSKCLFATGPLNAACGVDSDTKLAEQILEGTLNDMGIMNLANNYDDVSQELNVFIRAMTRPRNSHGVVLPDFDWSCGIKEYKNTFRKTREVTLCGPSGINMSYWKACAEDNDLTLVQSFFIEKVFQYSFSYPCWQVSIIYGPRYRGGLGLQSLDEKQTILHFELFQGHIR